MNADQAIIELQKIEWEGLSLEEAKQAAKDFMNGWDWQEKVPEFCRSVDKSSSVKSIAIFMWNATMKGLEIKQAKALGNLRY